MQQQFILYDVLTRLHDWHYRLYLVNSPVVRADNLRFKEEGVRDVVKDVFLPWYNAYRFLMQNVVRLQRVSLHFLRYWIIHVKSDCLARKWNIKKKKLKQTNGRAW